MAEPVEPHPLPDYLQAALHDEGVEAVCRRCQTERAAMLVVTFPERRLLLYCQDCLAWELDCGGLSIDP